MNQLKTEIADGQKFYDEPVFLEPKGLSVIDRSIRAVFNSPFPVRIHAGFQRVQLRWLAPNKTGKLIPK